MRWNRAGARDGEGVDGATEARHLKDALSMEEHSTGIVLFF